MVEALVCKINITRFESAPVLHMEGTAEWSATGPENRGLVTEWGSIPLLSSNLRKAGRAAIRLFAKQRPRRKVRKCSIHLPSAMEIRPIRHSVRRSVKPLPFGVSGFESQGLHQYARVAQRKRRQIQNLHSESSNLSPSTTGAYANRQSDQT